MAKRNKKLTQDDSVAFPQELPSWKEELKTPSSDGKETSSKHNFSDWWNKHKREIKTGAIITGAASVIIGTYLLGGNIAKSNYEAQQAQTQTAIVEQFTPTQTLDEVVMQPTFTPFPTEYPTYTATALPTQTQAPTATSTVAPTATAEPYNFCSNLKLRIAGRRLTQDYADLLERINQDLESYNYPSYKIMDATISADGWIQPHVQFADGTSTYPLLNDFSAQEISDYMTEVGGPISRPVVLYSDEIGLAYQGISDILTDGTITSVRHGANAPSSSAGDISSLKVDLESILGNSPVLYISNNAGNPVLAAGDEYDIYIDQNTYSTLMDFLGMDTNCGYEVQK